MCTTRNIPGEGFQYNPVCGRCSRVSRSSRSPSPSSQHTCNAHPICSCLPTGPCFTKSADLQEGDFNFGRSRPFSRAGSGSYRHSCSPMSMDLLRDHKAPNCTELSALLRRLSVLQIEMQGLLHGRSLRERVQSIGKKMDEGVDGIAAMNPLSNVWLVENSSAGKLSKPVREETRAVDKSKEMLAHSKEEGCSSPSRALQFQEPKKVRQKKVESTGDEEQDEQKRERKLIAQLWREYNCDLHLRRIIDSSRREAACRIVMKMVHRRLTCYMLQYIAIVAKGLIGDEKRRFMGLFKREGPFRNKPLNEGTYGELLLFVDKQAKPAKDVVKVLETAEEALQEECRRQGFNSCVVGDIRAQMRAVLAAMLASSACPSPVPGIFAASVSLHHDDEENGEHFTSDLLQDLIQAADQGKLGSMQKAHKLVKLACFLALRRMGVS